MSIQYFFAKMEICSCVFMSHHNVRFVPYDQVRIWAWCLLSWQHLVNPVIVLWTARSWVQVQPAGDTVLCLWVCDLLLQHFRAIHYPWSYSWHCHSSCVSAISEWHRAQLQGLEWQQMEGCRGCAWGPGVLGVSVGGIPGTLGGVSGYRRWTFPCVWLLRPSMSSVCSTNPSWLAAAPLAHAVLSLGEGTRPFLQSSTRKQQQHCRGTGSSLASAVPLGGKSSLQDSLVSTAAGTLHRYDFSIFNLCCLYSDSERSSRETFLPLE